MADTGSATITTRLALAGPASLSVALSLCIPFLTARREYTLVSFQTRERCYKERIRGNGLVKITLK